ncbi:hypothetical protein MRX96_004846 [Rhipicephalus microplus]
MVTTTSSKHSEPLVTGETRTGVEEEGLVWRKISEASEHRQKNKTMQLKNIKTVSKVKRRRIHSGMEAVEWRGRICWRFSPGVPVVSPLPLMPWDEAAPFEARLERFPAAML